MTLPQDCDARAVIKNWYCLTYSSHIASEKHQRDEVRAIDEADEDFFGIILGLSHAFSGIDKENLNKKFFDFSFGGRDMYYNLKLLKYAFKVGKFSNVKVALLVFPYYYFDYDQSRSYAQYESGQMFGVCRLDDWHNAAKIDDKRWKVQNYITQCRMFGKKLMDYYRGGYHKKNYAVYQAPPKTGKLPKGFFTDRPETVSENLSIFAELITILHSRAIKTVLIVPPIPVNELGAESYERLQFEKNKFHELVKLVSKNIGVNFYVADCVPIFNQREVFRDTEHLNAFGAVIFAKYLNQLVTNIK